MLTRGDESETDSGGESGGDNTKDGSDTDWNMTVKGPPSVYTGTDSIGYSEPINSVNVNSDRVSSGDLSRETQSVTSSDRSSRSPSKDVRATSPEKHIIPTGLSPAESEQQIASSFEKKRESRSMDNLNTAIENRAREEERRRKEEERRKLEERRQKEERRKSGVRDSREKSPPKPVKNPEIKDERRRDSKGSGRRSQEEPGRRSGSQVATINPLLSELARKHGAGGRESRHTDVVEELKNAFEVAERNSPGITNRLIEQILVKLQPGLGESRLSSAMDNLSL